jgi:hypothetical protein
MTSTLTNLAIQPSLKAMMHLFTFLVAAFDLLLGIFFIDCRTKKFKPLFNFEMSLFESTYHMT